MAANPASQPERVLLTTVHCVVAYDVYPKARVHLLLLPRVPGLSGPHALGTEHAPLLRHMTALAEWLAPQLRSQVPRLAPLRCGFHVVPSMEHLHLHLISHDFEAPDLKKPRHFISFTTDYLRPPKAWAEELERFGRLHVDRYAEEAKLKAPMRCPLSGRVLGEGLQAVKEYLRSTEYLDLVQRLRDDVVYALRS